MRALVCFSSSWVAVAATGEAMAHVGLEVRLNRAHLPKCGLCLFTKLLDGVGETPDGALQLALAEFASSFGELFADIVAKPSQFGRHR